MEALLAGYVAGAAFLLFAAMVAFTIERDLRRRDVLFGCGMALFWPATTLFFWIYFVGRGIQWWRRAQW